MGGATGSGGGSSSGAQGGEGGELNPGPLTLVSKSPDAGEESAWAYEPILLEFSDELDESTLAGSVRVQVNGQDVDVTVAVDETGTRVSIILDELPPMPARVSVIIASTIESVHGEAFSGASFSFSYPLWQVPGGGPAAASSGGRPAIAVAPDRSPAVLYSTADGGLAVALHQGAWGALPPLPLADSSASARPIGAEYDADGDLVVAWLEAGTGAGAVFVAKRADGQWQILGAGAAATGANLSVAFDLDAAGEPVIASGSEAGAVNVVRLTDGDWDPVGSAYDAGGSVREVALDASDAVTVAYVDDAFDLKVIRSDGASSFALLGGGIGRERPDGQAFPALVVDSSGAPIVAYLDGDEVSLNVQVAKFDSTWAPLGSALDLDIDAQVSPPSLALGAGDVPVVLWGEKLAGPQRLFAARWTGSGFRSLGGALLTSDTAIPPAPAMALDVDGNVNGVWVADGELELARFNGSPTLPVGIKNRGSRGSCAIPDDSSPTFPEYLSETGCYTGLATQTLVSAAIPYDINSILWSDGALKKRYVLLPEGEAAMFDASDLGEGLPSGTLGLPTGTIIIKEFYIERAKGDPSTLIPMETRFLVKRCGENDGCLDKWQGYSYQWNDAGNEGTLLDGMNPETKDWNVTVDGAPATHTHSYPSRAECVLCHNPEAGRVLGLQPRQLNRSFDYGHTVDNQLRAWDEAGLFGDSYPGSEPESLERLVSPPDVGRSLDERARSYLHTNCAHCHRAEGAMPSFRMTLDAPMAGNFCADAVKPAFVPRIDPGFPNNSALFVRDGNRGTQTPPQMPPLATVITDDRQLTLTEAWITAMLPDDCL